ncbi:hypothetical protein Zmor_011877 [Zophobas morio]|jgi:hypothetical protein|uniref:Uncharacterized protein n=1 Tax=Zophobas morio TaxID=2755281 RepID=A0AA38HJV1_9CUCU|nr:hypothetical protein Zmor_011877 [Zophobas morio]
MCNLGLKLLGRQAHWVLLLKAIHLSTSIKALNELLSYHASVLFKLREGKDTPKAITQSFTDWDKFAGFLETTLSPHPPLG